MVTTDALILVPTSDELEIMLADLPVELPAVLPTLLPGSACGSVESDLRLDRRRAISVLE